MVLPAVMYGCESWTVKKAEHQRIDAFELRCWRRLLSPLDSKEIKPANHKGNQPWIFIERTDAEAEAPILWPPDAKSRLIGKDPDSGQDWRQKEKRAIEDKMVGWHHWFNGHELGQTLGDGEGQGGLACCSPWCSKETCLSNWTAATSCPNSGQFWRSFQLYSSYRLGQACCWTYIASQLLSSFLFCFLLPPLVLIPRGPPHVAVCVCAQSCLILWDPMDCGPPGCSVHVIFWAKILE